MTQPQRPALIGSIVTPTDYAIFGGRLGTAGFDEIRLSEFMGRMERRATELGIGMAKTLTTEMAADMAQTMRNVHYNACYGLYVKLSNQNLGFGGLTHRKCCQAALDMAIGVPNHAPMPEKPAIGTPH